MVQCKSNGTERTAVCRRLCERAIELGTKRRKYLEQNVEAVDLELGPAQLTELEAIFPRGAASGTRYPEAQMGAVNR
jgi:hypothetical protein